MPTQTFSILFCGKIMAHFLAKFADKTSALFVFVFLYFKYDTLTDVTVGNAFITFTILLICIPPFLILFIYFILLYLFLVKTMCMHVHSCLCVDTPPPTCNENVTCCGIIVTRIIQALYPLSLLEVNIAISWSII